jgi:hypothetical protein
MRPDYGPFKRINRAKNGFIVSGTVLILGGAVMQGMGFYRTGMDDRIRNLLINYGYAPLGLGVLFLGGALFVNPKIPETDAAK